MEISVYVTSGFFSIVLFVGMVVSKTMMDLDAVTANLLTHYFLILK